MKTAVTKNLDLARVTLSPACRRTLAALVPGSRSPEEVSAVVVDSRWSKISAQFEDWIPTGHAVRLEYRDGFYRLSKLDLALRADSGNQANNALALLDRSSAVNSDNTAQLLDLARRLLADRGSALSGYLAGAHAVVVGTYGPDAEVRYLLQSFPKIARLSLVEIDPDNLSKFLKHYAKWDPKLKVKTTVELNDFACFNPNLGGADLLLASNLLDPLLCGEGLSQLWEKLATLVKPGGLALGGAYGEAAQISRYFEVLDPSWQRQQAEGFCRVSCLRRRFNR